MKRLITICLVVGMILAISGLAQAVTYVSTFNVTDANFSLTGFSSGGVPTTGPDNLYIDNVTGTYDLGIPPVGTSWDVSSSGSFWLDFDKDGTADATGDWNEYLGHFTSPGPAGIDTHWGPGSVDFTAEYDSTTYNFTLAYEIYFDNTATPSGDFGDDAFGDYTLSGDAAGMLLGNTYLTALDNASGGGDGVIDGWMGYTQYITCIPEPATIALLGLGALSLIRRKRSV